MKKVLFIAALAVLASCETKQDNTSQNRSAVESYGEMVSDSGALSGKDIMGVFSGRDSVEIKYSGLIEEVCQKKGCWMHMEIDDEYSLFVKFKDYEFFVPKDAAGKIATVEGMAYIDTVSIEELKHYAMDAGEPDSVVQAITEPEVRYTFMAKGVMIKGNNE